MNYRCHFIIISCLLFCAQISYAQNTLPFNEDFESANALDKWDIVNKEVSIKEIDNSKGGHLLRIERQNKWEFTRIRKEFRGIKGSLIVEADIQGEKIVPGQKSYQKGILQAVIIINGKEVGYINNKFTGTFGLSKKSIQVDDLTGIETVVVRIGLQNAKGIILVDNIRVFQP